MITPQLIHFALGQYLHLHSLKLLRIVLAHTFSVPVCAFLVSILGVGLLHHRLCVFNFSR